ncbi:VOC family protein [Streptomonospora salina]|uniref:Catechol-2,3-dioxygenase n=1 Tax=Streptomonospora salina TaxID=104205 RepID=A0A841EFI3_9ACTN|nr:VOC family protein [Streptomonospora salina]MBB5999813.1 catechol-2,3-dioxygenase [Streptomonospora salina]
MAIRLQTVVLEARDIRALARFYADLLGVRITRADDDWFDIGDDATTTLSFQHSPRYEPPVWPDDSGAMQIHLDFEVDDIDEAEAAALSLGATRLPWSSRHEVDQGLRAESGTGFRVYTDPAGHPFCLCWGGG